MQFVDLKSQYDQLRSKIDGRIRRVLEHGQFIMGPEVHELEERLSSFTGVTHSITCANGTDALVLALMALGVGKGDAVFCPTFTFFATAEAIAFLGATPVFVDCEPNGFNICCEHLEIQVNRTIEDNVLSPKAVIAVDLFGLPADYVGLEAIAIAYDLKVVEDAAQSFGGRIGDRIAPSFGDIATTSFFPAKPLGCYGDGGAVFTQNDEYAEVLRSLRVHGKGKDKYDNVRIGMNSRLDTLQAAILLEKLCVLENEISEREKIAQYYNSVFEETCVVPTTSCGFQSAWAQYTLLVDDRDAFRQRLADKGIPTAVYYEKCMHQQSAFSPNLENANEFKRAEYIASKCVSLPMHVYQDRLNFD